jgi:O-antigen ligase
MRIDYWEYAVKNIIFRFPWTGVGLGNFNSPFSRYAHNSYVQMGAEMGILGLAAFLWLIGSFLKACKKTGNRPSKDTQRIIYPMAILAFLIHNSIDFTFFLPEISLIGWIILGLSYKAYNSI